MPKINVLGFTSYYNGDKMNCQRGGIVLVMAS